MIFHHNFHMDTKEKAESYNERAKNQIRTKALQKGADQATVVYKEEIKRLTKENKALRAELDAIKEKLGLN